MATILLVEDEPLIRTLYLTVLRECSFRLLTAEVEEEATKLIKREVPDLILLDLLIPTARRGEDLYDFHEPVGFELLRLVQELRKKLKQPAKLRTVIISNLDSDEHHARALELGAEAYWVKTSFNPRDLPDRVMKLIV